MALHFHNASPEQLCMCIFVPLRLFGMPVYQTWEKNPFPNTDCEQSHAEGLKHLCHSETAALMCSHPAPPCPFPENLHALERAKQGLALRVPT